MTTRGNSQRPTGLITISSSYDSCTQTFSTACPPTWKTFTGSAKSTGAARMTSVSTTEEWEWRTPSSSSLNSSRRARTSIASTKRASAFVPLTLSLFPTGGRSWWEQDWTRARRFMPRPLSSATDSLRRDPDGGGYDFWLAQVNKFPLRDVSIQQAMACSFITSAEYQTRFSPIVTHTNRECPQ
jgi:hypothetical protein